MPGKALPALLITVAILPIIGVAVLITYLIKHSYRQKHHSATGEASPEPADPSTISASSLLPSSEKYAGPAPGTTYELQPQRPQAHPSIKRKRALPLVAARSAYTLPASGEAVAAPTHSGADWNANGAGHRQQKQQQQGVGMGRGVEVDGNFEEIHLGAVESEKLERGRPDSGVLEAEERNSLWGQKARRVAERQSHGGGGGGQGQDESSSGGEDGVLVIKREAKRAEEEEDKETLGSFDFEGEEAGRKKAKAGAKGWRLSLFGRSEYAA